MIRFAEIALLLTPLAAFIAWRVMFPDRPLGRWPIIVGMLMVLVMAGGLVWLRAEDAAPPNSIYIPQHMENGAIVPGRAVSK